MGEAGVGLRIAVSEPKIRLSDQISSPEIVLEIYSVDKLQVSMYVHGWAALTPSVLGWEGFQAGFESSRGITRGRSGFVGRGGGKYNLDNRTKKVAVTGDLSNEKDEALRQYLLVIVRL